MLHTLLILVPLIGLFIISYIALKQNSMNRRQHLIYGERIAIAISIFNLLIFALSCIVWYNYYYNEKLYFVNKDNLEGFFYFTLVFYSILILLLMIHSELCDQVEINKITVFSIIIILLIFLFILFIMGATLLNASVHGPLYCMDHSYIPNHSDSLSPKQAKVFTNGLHNSLVHIFNTGYTGPVSYSDLLNQNNSNLFAKRGVFLELLLRDRC